MDHIESAGKSQQRVERKHQGHYVASLIMLWVLGFKYPFNSSYSI